MKNPLLSISYQAITIIEEIAMEMMKVTIST